MIPPTISPILREALAAHEVLRTIGFAPDDIYFRPTPDRVLIMVKRGTEFNFDLGAHDVEVNQLIAQWADAIDWWNAGAEADRQELFERSQVRQQAVGLVAALVAKGFSMKRSDA